MASFAHSSNHYTNGLSEEKTTIIQPRKYKKVTSGVAIKLLGSKQDWVIKGQNDLFKYLVVLDGHGKGSVVEQLIKLKWNDLLLTHNERPDHLLAAINEYIILGPYSFTLLADNFRDGSTCSIVKMFESHIECYTIGDSQVGIKINNNYFYTKNHDLDHEEDVNRLKEDKNVVITETWKGKVLNDNDITMVKGKYFDHPTPFDDKKDCIAMTRSLGHNYGKHFSTLQEFELFRIDYTSDDNVTIIAATDGLWDVVHDKNAILSKFEEESITHNAHTAITRLMNRTENKWTQKWNYYWEGKLAEQTKFPNPDDIGIGYLVHI